MPATSTDAIKNDIAESRLPEAITSVVAAWEKRAQRFYNLALQVQARYHFLQSEIAKGVISQSDADLERAKITDALLFLTDRLSNPKAEAPRHLQDFLNADAMQKRAGIRWVVPALMALSMVVLGYFFIKNLLQPATFDLKVYLYQFENHTLPITEGKIQLQIGDHLFPARAIETDGRIIFTDIPAAYLNDSIQLIPIEMPYQIADQDVWLATPDQTVKVQLEPLVQWTQWRGKVLDEQGKPLAGATLEIESGLATGATDANGNFDIKVPKTSGEQVQLTIYHQGRSVYTSSGYTISETQAAQITVL